ncbi:tripartite tricarboxylate transporter TctB family protein [Telmatospirillum sp. J64-1]|uniref:tripartite tricarboxylate transporter TctB family protein n=1 Tax=Telmatospirillum sp. J64-1 TaxID=2502183 RepID=UPI00115CD20B|nr:tripartite tricarboxylate transporter TctB family protein [Telmatospirillum sp. J64-1]
MPDMPIQTRQRDWGAIVVTLCLMAVAGWALWEAQRMSELGKLFPITFGGLMLTLCSILLVKQLLGRSTPRLELEGSMPRRALLVVVMIAWIALLPVLGFVVAGLLGFFAIMAIAGHDGWPLPRLLRFVAIGIAVVALIAWIFQHLLHVPLPAGRVFF